MLGYEYSAHQLIRVSFGRSQFSGCPNSSHEEFIEKFKRFMDEADLRPVDLTEVYAHNGGGFFGLFVPSEALRLVEWLEANGVEPKSDVSVDFKITRRPSALPKLRSLCR